MKRPIVCSIGASEPWNAAGVGLDIVALRACGARAVTVVAGVTAQDRDGLRAAAAVAPELIDAQFEALAGAEIAAYRIGALLDARSVEVVAARVALGGAPVVYDPVLGPSAGGAFADAATRAAIARCLIPIATLVTPNLGEAAALTGAAVAEVADMERAGRALVAVGAAGALVKGGHLAGDAVDVYVDARRSRTYAAPRLPGDLRGTGCLLACGIAAAFARGETAHDAIEAGRRFVRERFATAVEADGARAAY